ncbi:uncharacterized protein LOC128551680 isoform X3 [Mercenaria mercenaria]|uniref:uncharacterized protein LOC128551680 isoform X3 n=1 Tax=Mercenaria mercenaria TaxID=6596 RepID=UPI00234EFC5D|nr:uncharacterized protein LOC128551680 isoform X3 [Mercenaria mercenaria]
MEFVRIFLHWIFFPGCMMWIKLILMLACIDGIEDVEQQQVFQRSELPKQYILQNKLKFKVLQQPSICSYRNLTSCHTDSHLHEAYYEQCYSDACPKEKYFCLNNPSGNTIHLCGQAYTWKKHCNCAPKCRAFEEREWSGSFMCRTIGENATDPEDTTQDRERVTQVTESYEPSSGQTVHQANNEVDIGIKGLDKDLSAVDNKIQNTDNYESNHLLMTIGLVTIIIAVILVSAVVVGIFVSVFVVKHRHIDGGFANYSTVSQGDSVDDQSVQSAVEDAGNTNKDTKKSGQVNKISSTKIKKTTYHVHTNNATLNFNQEHQGTRNLEIQNASESIDIEACLENVPENKPSLLPPQMQNLKVLELETSQPDSGIHTTDQTYEKTQQ